MLTKNSELSQTWIDPDDAPELTEAMMADSEIFQGDVFIRWGRGRPKLDAAKEQISVRLDLEVLARLRTAGPGWQSHVNALLREPLKLDNDLKANVKKLSSYRVSRASTASDFAVRRATTVIPAAGIRKGRRVS